VSEPFEPSSAASSASQGAGTADTLSAEVAGRALLLDELAFLNRMTTTGMVLPNVAHELNNALQVVGGLVEMLAARGDLPADVLEKVGRIGAQAAKSAAMVRELVAFSRRDQGGVGVVDAARVVEQALALRRYHLSRARVVVTTEIGEGGPHVLRADGHHLLQVLVNVIINAEQALEGRTGPTLRVGVRRGAAGAVEITIDDNGAPIDELVAARACDAFYTTRSARAMGLGLAVGRALVARDGGTLEVAALGQSGTRAMLRFP
jgi:signal transduction histidine kinase